MKYIVRDPDYEARVRESFGRQQFMATLGAHITRVAPGEVDITFAFRDDLTQQNGYVHAGAVTSVVDSACGYAALTLMAPGADVLSVEFKVNLIAPAKGTEFVAKGRVVRSGRTITVVAGELCSAEVVVAVMQGTMMALQKEDRGQDDRKTGRG